MQSWWGQNAEPSSNETATLEFRETIPDIKSTPRDWELESQVSNTRDDLYTRVRNLDMMKSFAIPIDKNPAYPTHMKKLLNELRRMLIWVALLTPYLEVTQKFLPKWTGYTTERIRMTTLALHWIKIRSIITVNPLTHAVEEMICVITRNQSAMKITDTALPKTQQFFPCTP